jgi:DNA (cytosine-5)-methyltransferase 1
MDLIRTYIDKLIYSGQQAKDKLNQDELTPLDIQKALGDLDFVESRLLAAKILLLIKTGKPYIIENVAGAPLNNPLKLFGSQFKNLYTQRERWFESNIPLVEPEEPRQKMKTLSAGNGIGEDGSISIVGNGGVRGLNSKQIRLYWGFAMGGIDWMSRAELAEAIPPAYTEFLGKQLIDYLKVNA